MRLRFSDTTWVRRKQDAMRGLGEMRWMPTWLLVEQAVTTATIQQLRKR
ncbi:MAG TPA: hypothetical protein VFQ88_09635 [Nevskiaceae bacterium]|nr:hypothetical protein [Nevskiaceae bacterium]